MTENQMIHSGLNSKAVELSTDSFSPWYVTHFPFKAAQWAEATEYTDCISVEEQDFSRNEGPEYDIKQSDRKAQTLRIWGIWSTSLLPLLPGILWLGAVQPDRVLSMDQIEQTMCANKWLMLNCDCYIAIHEII